MKRSVPAVLAAALVAAAAWPAVQRWNARRAAAARVGALAAGPGAACEILDPGLSLRVTQLGPWLASWETVGGCGSGGGAGVGTGVMWIGHNVTGGLFDVFQLGNYIHLTGDPELGTPSPGWNFVSVTQIMGDVSNKWRLGASIPLIYKYYYNPGAAGYDISNGGLGDVSAIVERKLGPINATKLRGIVGFPTGQYRGSFMMTELPPDQQLGFGRVTGTLMLEHTIDETWGLILLGAAGGYRGGKNAAHNYRAPGGSVYGYVGWNLGSIVPALGATLTGFTRQDERGDFGDTINAPVAMAAANASIEWSNDYLAILLGAQIPYALRGKDWSHPAAPHYGWQPWTLALGLNFSPF
jgi:hypothetical protein